jgi:hypothetical protein
MTLSFPTYAEQCLAAWRAHPTTIALREIARRYRATKTKRGNVTEYSFDDDTRLEVRGKGRSHKVEALLP